MKRFPLIFMLFFLSCAVPKPAIVTSANFSNHPQPYRISTIGGWNPNFNILTLIDAHDAYFTILVPSSSSFKKGDIYNP